MIDWRAIGYGLITFLLALGAALAHAAPWILLTGVPSGFIAGYRQQRILSGLLYGCATGICIAVLFLGGVFSLLIASAPKGVYPGVGFAIVGIFMIAVLLLIESILAGALGSLLGRS